MRLVMCLWLDISNKFLDVPIWDGLLLVRGFPRHQKPLWFISLLVPL
jgi:hypothetical protein